MHIGFGSEMPAEFVRIILYPSSPANPRYAAISSPLRRLMAEAKAAGRLVDATKGRRIRAIIITDSNHLVLSAVHPETLIRRFEEERGRLIKESLAEMVGRSENQHGAG
jgi:regulator of extracellular matrix RemA (YlzA/DUF370 family)